MSRRHLPGEAEVTNAELTRLRCGPIARHHLSRLTRTTGIDRKDTLMDTRSHPAARRIGGLRGPARLGIAALAATTVAGAVLAAAPAFAATASHQTGVAAA